MVWRSLLNRPAASASVLWQPLPTQPVQKRAVAV